MGELFNFSEKPDEFYSETIISVIRLLRQDPRNSIIWRRNYIVERLPTLSTTPFVNNGVNTPKPDMLFSPEA